MTTKQKTRPVIEEGQLIDSEGKALARSKPKEIRELADQAIIQPLSVEDRAMNMIAAAVADGRSVEEIGRLIEFKERLEQDQARKAYNRAMAEFQALCPAIPKTGRATISTKSGGRYEYSFPQLDVIMEIVRPHLASCGLSVTFSDFVLEDGHIALSCLIRHSEGHIESHPIRMPIDRGANVNDMQKVGISNSYARRYGVVNALNLVGADPDSDGNLPGTKEVETITDEQLITLRDWISSTGADENKMLDFFNLNDLEHLPARRYNEALNILKQRKKMLEKKAEGEGGES
jgi:hypothetical protein